MGDIFASSFVHNMSAVTALDMFFAVGASLIAGVFIYFIYSHVYDDAMYSPGFGVSMVVLPMITAAMILSITSNVTFSLGMVGAMSIVRFRAAIKDPLDIVFLFWAIEAGIVMATGLIPLGIGVNLLIGLILWGLYSRSQGARYILVLTFNVDVEDKVKEEIKKANVTILNKKSRIQKKEEKMVETVWEVVLPKAVEDSFTNPIAEIPGVEKAMLVGYNGAYTG